MSKIIENHRESMLLNELIPTVDRLSRQDKLRLIHFLILAVAKEEGCSLEPDGDCTADNTLLAQLAATDAVVWSPQADQSSVQALLSLLVSAKEATNA